MRELFCIYPCNVTGAQHLRQACNVLPAEPSTRVLSNWTSEGDIAVQKRARNKLSLHGVAQIVLGSLSLPQAAWSRLLVLFVALTGAKLALIVSLGKRLFESHWRLTPHLPVWEDYLLFGFFVVVGFLSLMRLQRHCALAGLRAVRAASAMVLGFGLIFIFFTFHAQSRNYLFPILTGVLDWNSLVPYLSLDLFFHPPFLGVWLFVYALSYYLLVRSGRESWVLHLTAIFGAAYALVALRELAVARTELLVVSSLGVAFLMFGQRTEEKIRSVWLLAPLAWCLIFVAALFRFVPWEIGLSVTYLWLL